MSFKFEVPGCMQNKVGCFVDLSDSAICDESGSIPTTEDLEAVIDYNLTENCPKWMMQYPEHAGLIGAYIVQADTVRQAFKSMMPKQGDFYGGNKWQILFNVWWATVVMCYGWIMALSMTRRFSWLNYLISAIIAGTFTNISSDLFISLSGRVIFYLSAYVAILGIVILLKPTFSSGVRYSGY